MARCAVCRSPIEKGQQFGLVDEFVVHRACQGGRIAIRREKVLLEEKIADQNMRIATLEKRVEDIYDLRRRLNSVHDDYMDALAEISQLRSQIADRDATIASERTQRALAELRERSTRAPAEQPSEPREREQISSEPVDITAARFSLLELD